MNKYIDMFKKNIDESQREDIRSRGHYTYAQWRKEKLILLIMHVAKNENKVSDSELEELKYYLDYRLTADEVKVLFLYPTYLVEMKNYIISQYYCFNKGYVSYTLNHLKEFKKMLDAEEFKFKIHKKEGKDFRNKINYEFANFYNAKDTIIKRGVEMNKTEDNKIEKEELPNKEEIEILDISSLDDADDIKEEGLMVMGEESEERVSTLDDKYIKLNMSVIDDDDFFESDLDDEDDVYDNVEYIEDDEEMSSLDDIILPEAFTNQSIINNNYDDDILMSNVSDESLSFNEDLEREELSNKYEMHYKVVEKIGKLNSKQLEALYNIIVLMK